MKLFGKIDLDDIHKTLIVLSLVFGVSALFMPLVIIFIAQDLLFHSREHWYFGTPGEAYLIAGVGMLTVPAVTLLYFLLSKWKSAIVNSNWFISFVLLAVMITGIPFYHLGIHTYFFLDDDGVHQNELRDTSLYTLEWEDVAYFVPELRSDDGLGAYETYHFISRDQQIVSIPFNTDIIQLRSRFISLIEEGDGEILRPMSPEEFKEWKESRDM